MSTVMAKCGFMLESGVSFEQAAERRSRVFWLLVVVAVIVVDQITKYLANNTLGYAQPHPVLPVLDITLHYNRGAAFGFFLS
jgi:signal peptidase II